MIDQSESRIPSGLNFARQRLLSLCLMSCLWPRLLRVSNGTSPAPSPCPSTGAQSFYLAHLFLLVFPLLYELHSWAHAVWGSRVLPRLVVSGFLHPELIYAYQNMWYAELCFRFTSKTHLSEGLFCGIIIEQITLQKKRAFRCHFMRTFNESLSFWVNDELCFRRNSETIPYFWSNWNIPVHKWCLRWDGIID